jgi:hypothetical protein
MLLFQIDIFAFERQGFIDSQTAAIYHPECHWKNICCIGIPGNLKAITCMEESIQLFLGKNVGGKGTVVCFHLPWYVGRIADMVQKY